MNDQNITQEPEKKKSSAVKVVAITALTTALLVGGSVYWWQKLVQKSLIEKYQITKSKTEQKTEQKQDTSTLIANDWKTYIEPNEYSIQYPPHWYLRGGSKHLGDEILQLWNHNIENIRDGHEGLSPNSAKVALSIRMKNSKTLEEIIFEEHCKEVEGPSEIKGPLQIEKLTVNGQPAVRLYYIAEGDTNIYIFINYKDDKYASIISGYGRGSKSDLIVKEIKKIQESFKIIQ